MGFINRLFGIKPNKGQITVSSGKQTVVVTTSFPSQAAAEEVLAAGTDSEARLDAATALGKTNSLQVVPALAKALSSDLDKYVRSACAGYLGSIKGAEAEKSLLQAMADPDPYVRKKIVEGLFRLETEQARKAIEGALKDADPEVRAEAEKYASKTTKKIQNRLCPFLSESGMCEPPGVSDLHECSWETQGRGHYNGCFVYKMHVHPGGPGDFIRRNM
jgi:HEAT repeats/PBS lyase HEAT-like repeat